MAAAQAAYDNMDPPDDIPVVYLCGDCNEVFNSDEQKCQDECPHCDSENFAKHTPEPYFREPD